MIAKRLERAIQSSGCATAEENSYTEVSGGSWCKNVYDSRTEGKEERGGGGGGGGSDKHWLRCGWDIEVRDVYSFRMLAAWKGWI